MIRKHVNLNFYRHGLRSFFSQEGTQTMQASSESDGYSKNGKSP